MEFTITKSNQNQKAVLKDEVGCEHSPRITANVL